MPHVEMAGLDTIVKVGGEVRDLIGEVDDLGFEGRPLVEEVVSEVRIISDTVVARVLDDSFPRTESEIEAAMPCISLFETFHDTERMQVVIEAETVGLQATVQGAFAGVAKGRMTYVVHQGQRLREIYVQTESGSHLARHLSDLDGVREPAPEVVGGTAGEDLRLSRQPPKRPRLDDTITVAFKGETLLPGRGREGALGQETLLFSEHSTSM
jgi:hypothetical protein